MRVLPEHYLRLALYHSAHGLVVDKQGRRFTDEALGDEVSAQMTTRLPGQRAVLLWDADTQRDRVCAAPFPSGLALDRFSAAEAVGARTASADSLEDLLELTEHWGVDSEGVRKTVSDLRRNFAGDERVSLDAATSSPRFPPLRAPFSAVEVQPAITIAFGGIEADVSGSVLDRQGHPIPGLFAIGADVGGAGPKVRQWPHYRVRFGDGDGQGSSSR